MARAKNPKGIKAALAEIGLDHAMDGTWSLLTGSLASATQAAEAVTDLPYSCPTTNGVFAGVSMGITGGTEAYAKQSDTWIGGTPKELRNALSGNLDMSVFQAKLDEFQRSKLGQKLTSRADATEKRRKRFFSEHDGEWDHDRQWEIAPFQSTRREDSQTKVIDVKCHFAVSAWTSAAELQNYGAAVWAVTQLIEKAGIQTSISYVLGCNNVAENLGVKITLGIKKPGEYLAPSFLAACFTPNFFRRVGFLLYILACDAAGKAARQSLGQPIGAPSSVTFKDGVLSLSPQAMGSGAGFSAKSEAALLKAICGDDAL
jgi:hypothetical protein